MKKNIIKDLTEPKRVHASRMRRWDILPRIFCVLLALLLWLAVASLSVFDGAKDEGAAPAASAQEQEATE